MNTVSDVLKVLDDVQTGALQVYWKAWSFSGGRDYGDDQIYSLMKGDEVFGEIYVNECNGVTVRDSKGDILSYEVNESSLLETADRILYNAVQRDDKKIVKILSYDGQFLGLPRDYHDITRSDVIEGRWPEEY
ncbi:MAG: hypothetical protein J5525_12295 [Lachnospiraceae bacterium]|nr:hypothetical protein [Lachnospiraceae bacterium]